MTKRLADIYQPGDKVEIALEGVHWTPARVVQLQHPGAWVLTGEGALWFVTNGRRIRKREETRKENGG